MLRPDLTGIGVLVTRPAHQAGPLCKLIQAAGGRAISYPVLDIGEPEDTSVLHEQLDRLNDFDIAIFISPNAVQRAFPMIEAHGGLPADIKVATVGRGSARELKHLGREPDICPDARFDSETLLAMDEMTDVDGKAIIIFRGVGGRGILANTLRERGADVEYAEVYRRFRPEADNTVLIQAWEQGELDIITATSSEGLHNLYAMAGDAGHSYLRETPLIVISERTVIVAEELGFDGPVIVARAASDEAMVEAVSQWAADKAMVETSGEEDE
ncbi:MAG: uroporphyrinogen-III synthase [Gammaproteobacteria bacterium]|nr:uroporphyrinogen-III synthase [Gammaproteobacteria bacterium]